MTSRNASSGKEPVVLQLFIFREGRFWGTECFAQGSLMIGRSPEVDLQLDDDITSRMHARLDVTPEGVVLEDQESANGTFVNGEPVRRCLVTSRDEISIGAFTLKIKLLNRGKPQARFRDETRVIEKPDELAAEGPSLGLEPEAGEDFGEPAPETTQRAFLPEDVRAARARPAEFRDESVPTRRFDELPSVMTEEPGAHYDLDAQPTQVQAPPGATLTVTAEESPPARQVRGVEPPVESMADLLEPEPLAVTAARLQEDVPDAFGAPLGLEPRPVARATRPAGPAAWPELASEAAPPAASRPGAEAGPARAAGDEEDEDEDELTRDFVEPFSLLNNLIRENFAEPSVPTEGRQAVEVIRYSSVKDVLAYEQLAPGGKHTLGPDQFVMLRYLGHKGCQVLFTDDFSGGVIAGGQTVALDTYKSAAHKVRKHKGRPVYGLRLQVGDYANLVHEGGGSFVRFVAPPKVPKARTQLRVETKDVKSFTSSAFGHLLFLVVLAIMATQKEAAADVDLDRFAKVDLKDIQMEKPEEEVEIPLDKLPEPEKKEEEKVEQKDEPKPEEKPKPDKKPTKVAKKAKAGDGKPEAPEPGAGMLAALGNLSKDKPQSTLVTQVTNLDAVRVPGANSRYKVSGLVTKLPTSNVVMSSGGGVGVKGGIDLLRGGKGSGAAGIGPGALGGGSTGKRSVGGVVFKAPKRNMQVRGTLSREAIAAVVQKHLKEIQYCYERNLLLNPNLSGKVIMEWTISTSGTVSVVKTATNTMQSPAVAICISAKIKTWKFPEPKGGVVVVTYPFIFNSVGF
jgi:pSer/pThr/pTyr-binding forkhead associated (FHA) protein